MHRTQSAKPERKNQKMRDFCFLRRTFSASAHQPQHQRQQQSAEKQAYNSNNYDLDRIHDASVAQSYDDRR
jgi:hypothetical protein